MFVFCVSKETHFSFRQQHAWKFKFEPCVTLKVVRLYALTCSRSRSILAYFGALASRVCARRHLAVYQEDNGPTNRPPEMGHITDATNPLRPNAPQTDHVCMQVKCSLLYLSCLFRPTSSDVPPIELSENNVHLPPMHQAPNRDKTLLESHLSCMNVLPCVRFKYL